MAPKVFHFGKKQREKMEIYSRETETGGAGGDWMMSAEEGRGRLTRSHFKTRLSRRLRVYGSRELLEVKKKKKIK